MVVEAGRAEKLPPHDIEAEEAVIASLLVDPEAIYKVAPKLKSEDFFREKNGWAYEACLALWERNESINQIAKENLEGQLRSILGTLTVEELIGDRKKLNEGVLEGAETELLKLGLRISILTIQDITDEVGYIKSLGKKRTAEVQRDATIGEAEAQSKARIAASQARDRAETTKGEEFDESSGMGDCASGTANTSPTSPRKRMKLLS